MKSSISWWAIVHSHFFLSFVCFFCLLSLWEAANQYRDGAYVTRTARQVIQQAGARTTTEKVVALRDYLRQHVTFTGAAHDNRPFLRDPAGVTLRTGKGYCGEVTRAFICMAHAVGVPAQRINLYGKQPHVVAEAELGPRNRVVVDCQRPPTVPELVPLDRLILQPEWDDYSTLNVRRLHLSRILWRTKLEMGSLTYWSENPHALKSAFWLSLALLLLTLKLCRAGLRRFLKSRGWVHSSSLRAPAGVSDPDSKVLAAAVAPSDRERSSARQPRASGGSVSPRGH